MKFSAGAAAKVAGGMVGVGTHIATGNPFIGAAVGTTVAHTLERIGNEVISRHLTPRQEVRVGRVFAVTHIKLQALLEAGKTLRNDDFFDANCELRTDSEEITEAAFQTAMNSVQEKKIDFIGALLANISIDKNVDVSTAYLLIDLAQSLSFRSFVLLKIAGMIDSYGVKARLKEAAPQPQAELHPLMVEIFELVRKGVVEMKDSADDDTAYAVLGPEEIDPAKMRLSVVGQLLHDKLELASLDESDSVYETTFRQIVQLSKTGTAGIKIDAGSF